MSPYEFSQRTDWADLRTVKFLSMNQYGDSVYMTVTGVVEPYKGYRPVMQIVLREYVVDEQQYRIHLVDVEHIETIY